MFKSKKGGGAFVYLINFVHAFIKNVYTIEEAHFWVYLYCLNGVYI